MLGRKIIYSCLVGGYDEIPEIGIKAEGWEYILFTDIKNNDKEIKGWMIKPLLKIIENDNVRTNRWHKLNSHLLFKSCLFSVYIDSNIIINNSYIYTRSEALFTKNVLLATVKHPFRKCIYKEAEECIRIGKDKSENVNKNLNLLKKENYPVDNGLFENNIFFRNHTINRLKEFNELWWELVYTMSRRDQLSMCYVLWKLNLECEYIFEDIKMNARNTPYFKFVENHKINNNFINKIEITNKEYNKLIVSDQKLQKIKNSISYKVFYKLEKPIKKILKY